MTYDIPVDEEEGYIQMQLLGRRIARASVHFFQVGETTPATHDIDTAVR